MKIGGREFQTQGHTYVMGIINVTPDSFYSGSRYREADRILRRAQQMAEEGADVLDIGGESTRPGYTEVPAAEEIERVTPVIEMIKSRIDIPLSVDTYKPQTAEAALRAGADMVNDIWGLRYDHRMAEVIAAAGTPCCLMHNRRDAVYRDLMGEMLDDLRISLEIAERAGIAMEKIVLDPGVGFGKTYAQNLEVINRLDLLHTLGCPVLLGASRKSVIGDTLHLPPEERLEGTLAVSVYAALRGAMFVRVHDVKENVRAVRMAEAVRDGG